MNDTLNDSGPNNPRSSPVLGVIVPPADGAIPPELPQLYGGRLACVGAGLGLPQMSQGGYDSVIGRVAELSRALAAKGAQAIALMGTSLSFYRGAEFNDRLVDTMREATGLPATTMSNAIVDALRAVGARRLAVGTAYNEDVNSRLASFLAASGFEVLALESMGLLSVEQVLSVTQDELMALGLRAAAAAPDADALLISCGGLRTLALTAPLEQRIGKPVISSAVAGAWAAARLLGLEPPSAGRAHA